MGETQSPAAPRLDPAPSRVLFVTGRLAEPALRRTLGDMAPPFAYGRTSSQYGEKNSVGPETARMLREALADRVSEAPKETAQLRQAFSISTY